MSWLRGWPPRSRLRTAAAVHAAAAEAIAPGGRDEMGPFRRARTTEVSSRQVGRGRPCPGTAVGRPRKAF